MSVTAGDRFGPYEILGPVGQGGMGTVWRARDPRLGREVAIKLVQSAVDGDRERWRRFELEARAASALEHPNLLTVFDVGTQDGQPYLVTELLAGRSLREMLQGGEPVPPRRALDWALQALRGLAAAHERGIVHRDLKPENLFVTRDGRLKILDFGLAKLTGSGAGAFLDTAPTAELLTGSGAIVGTVGYMAPEQVRGEPVDARTDLFALGCVLYELLGGKRAFARGSAADTLSAILRDEPAPLVTAADGTPLAPSLSRLVERCLQKSPAERWQSARDLAFRLEEIAQVSSASEARTAPLDAVAAEAPAGRTTWAPAGRRALVALALLLGLAAAATTGWRWRAAWSGGEPVRWQRVSFRHGVPNRGRFAPDGKTILYSEIDPDGVRRLYSTRTDSPESTALPVPTPATLLAVSSAGQLALQRHGTLSLASLAGGGAREVLQDVHGADFSADGGRLAVIHHVGDRDVLELPAGTRLYDPGAGEQLSDVRVSPDGTFVAVAEARGDVRISETRLLVVDRSGRARTLSRGWAAIAGVAWSPRGEVWFTGQPASSSGGMVLFAATLAGRTRLVQTVPGLVRVQDIDAQGRVLLLHSLWPNTLVCKTPDGAERDLSWLDFSTLVDVSADGRTVLFAEDGIAGGGGGAIYVRSLDGGDAVRLGQGEPLGISLDGRWVVARTVADAHHLQLLPTGAGMPRILDLGQRVLMNAFFDEDGRSLVVRARDPDGVSRTYLMPLAGGPLRLLLDRDADVMRSADGRFAVIWTDNHLQVQPLDGSGPLRDLPGIEVDDTPIRFDASGRGLYVGRGENSWDLRRVDLASGAATPLYHVGPGAAQGITWQGAVVSADARTYCYSYMRDISDLYVVSGLR